MKKVVLLGASLLLPTSVLSAELEKEIASCAAVEGELARLDCYDSLANKHKLDKPQPTGSKPTGTGKWMVSEEVNPIDDSKTVTLVLDASSGKSKWNKKVYFIARCKSNKTDVYIGWNDYLGRDASVLTRIGSNKAVTSKWSLSTDSQATFHRKPISFLKSMEKADTLIAQTTPYNESPVTAIFDTAGLSNALIPLRKTCSW
ncbi:type VI secretion system-associated protein TagO [Vibrio sp. 1159]|uniref:type VI secretion system-associated protein TagO n=1 Tax=Vibrio sp. 1159 TaxID=3074545 RepID=UPI0029655D73|nr:type VI secretion system-associated protein TagO [Vibrio sp. 1159]MDW2321305.1 type VI secretion system-associated protein TagO [Vibrio sp. 1159]